VRKVSSSEKTEKCPDCGHEFELFRGGLPCHGPCPVGEKIFVPRPPIDKKLERRLKRMLGSTKLTDEQIRKAT
jgi:hypothetical protein